MAGAVSRAQQVKRTVAKMTTAVNAPNEMPTKLRVNFIFWKIDTNAARTFKKRAY
jgi:hypothetical protein